MGLRNWEYIGNWPFMVCGLVYGLWSVVCSFPFCFNFGLMPVNTSSRKIFDFGLLRRVLQYAGPYKSRFYWSVFLAVILAVITPVRPLLIQVTINRGIGGKTESAGSWLNGLIDSLKLHDLASIIIAITILQVAILLVETYLRYLFSYITSWLGQTVVRDLRIKSMKNYWG
jgi:ATP-binding cassette subfamily B protein